MELQTTVQAAKSISENFLFLWLYLSLSSEELQEEGKRFCAKYVTGVGEDLIDELQHLKAIHSVNFDTDQMKTNELLNRITMYKLEHILPNVRATLRLFLTIPVTVASAKRSFSKLKLIKILPAQHHAPRTFGRFGTTQFREQHCLKY